LVVTVFFHPSLFPFHSVSNLCHPELVSDLSFPKEVVSFFISVLTFFFALKQKRTKKVQGCRNRIRVRSRAHARQREGGWL
jgi:hypothetical protein